MKNKTIITYGTFDIFHVGHVRLLSRLKNMGDRLIVGVSTDNFNHLKGKKSLLSFDDRYEVVSAIKFVDLVIPEESWEQKISDIAKYNVDIFGIGDDWIGRFDELKAVCEVVYLPRTYGISSTKIKSSSHCAMGSSMLELRNSAESILQIINSFGITNFDK